MSSLKYRPMAITGFTALIIMFLCVASDFVFSGGAVFLAVGAVSTIVLIITKEFKNYTVLACICGAMIFSGVLLMSSSVFSRGAAENFTEKECYVEAVVTDDTATYNNSNAYVLKTDSINGERIRTKILAYTKTSFVYEAGDKISFRSKLTDNISGRNFTGRLSYIAEEEYLYSFLTDSSDLTLIKSGGGTLQRFLYLVRSGIKSRITGFLSGKEGAVTVAMLTGDKSGVDAEIRNDFSRSGISHLFAVSGLHLSVWVMSLYTLIKKLTRKRKIPEIICIIFTLFFMVLTGFTASVCRAGLMLLLVLSARIFSEDSDSLNSLGAAVFVILAVNPMSAVSVSLLLSFFATWGIITAYPPIERKIDEKLFNVENEKSKAAVKYLLSLGAISVCASLFTLPVSSFFIGSVSAVAPVTNAFVSLAATFQMITGGLCAIFSPVPFIARIFALLCGLSAKYVMFVSSFLADIPFSSFSTDSVYFRASVIVIAAGAVCAALILKSAKKRIISFAAIILAVSVVSSTLFFIFDYGTTSVKVFQTGDSVSVIINHNGYRMIAGCGGGENYPADYMLTELDGGADFLLVPDRSFHNSSMVMYFTENCAPDTVICGESSQTLSLLKSDYKISDHFKFEPWNGAELEFIHTGGSSFARFKEKGQSFLIIFNCDNMSVIPREFLSGTLITTCEIPSDFYTDFFENTVVVSDKKSTKKFLEKVSGKNIYSACDFNCIDIKINKNSTLTFYCDER